MNVQGFYVEDKFSPKFREISEIYGNIGKLRKIIALKQALLECEVICEQPLIS